MRFQYAATPLWLLPDIGSTNYLARLLNLSPYSDDVIAT